LQVWKELEDLVRIVQRPGGEADAFEERKRLRTKTGNAAKMRGIEFEWCAGEDERSDLFYASLARSAHAGKCRVYLV
jgi:hypothetical protein